MKVNRINLLSSSFDYIKAEKKFALFRKVVFAYCMLIVIVIVSSFILLSSLSRRINDLTREKATLLEATTKKIEKEAELNYVAKKVGLMDEYLKKDAHALPYYNHLVEAMSISTQSAKLESFRIDFNRDVSFDVSFSNLQDMLSFFRFIESDAFLRNFESLRLSSFSSKSNRAEVKSFQLSLNGRFVEITQDTP